MIETRIHARHPGVCVRCGAAFDPGTLIIWCHPDRDAGETGRSRVWHFACPRDVKAPTPAETPDPAPSPDPEAGDDDTEPEAGDPDPDPDPAEPEKPAKPAPPPPPAGPDDVLGPVIEEVWRRIEPRVRAVLPETPPAKPDKPIRRRILIVERPNGDRIEVEQPHKRFAALAQLLAGRKHTYLYGDAGTGKSHAAGQIAAALGLAFREISLTPRTVPSAFFGFTDAHGQVTKTAFRLCWQDGGVLLLDELDNSSADMLAALNACLANGFAEFPDARVPKHPDCIIIGAGNTPGFGPTLQFPNRRALDHATRTRFRFLAWDYDLDMERAVCRAYAASVGIPVEAADAWCQWIIDVRDYCTKHYPTVLPSPRASYHGAQDLAEFDVRAVADYTVFQGLEPATVKAILAAHPLPAIERKPAE